MPLWKDIYFSCPACGGSLMVDRSGAGLIAPCPHCAAAVRVPSRSRLPPAWSRRLLLAGIALFGLAAMAGVYVIGKGAGASAGDSRDADLMARAARRPQPPLRAEAAAVKTEARPDALLTNEAAMTLKRENESLKQQYEDLGNWVLQNVKGRFPIPDRMVASLRLPAVTDDYRLHADVAEVLSIKPEERALVDDALMATRETIADVISSHLSVTQTAPNKASIYIPAFAKEGGQIKEDLYAALSTAIGDARFRRLLDMSGEQLARQYHYFGEAQHTMVFEQATVDGNPDDRFLVIKDGWIKPDGDSKRTYEVTETSVRELPAEYTHLLSILPAYVGEFAKAPKVN